MPDNRCPECDHVLATQAEYDAHPEGCECDRCRDLCWRAFANDPASALRYRGLCVELARLERERDEERASADGWRDRYSEQCHLYHTTVGERDAALAKLAACERDAMSAPRLLRELGEARLAIRWLMSSNWAEPGTDYIISRAVDAALEVSHEP